MLIPSGHGRWRLLCVWWQAVTDRRKTLDNRQHLSSWRAASAVAFKRQHIPGTELIGHINRHLAGKERPVKMALGSRHAGDQLARGKSGDQAPPETQPAALASSRRNHAGDPSQKSRTGTALRNFTPMTKADAGKSARPV